MPSIILIKDKDEEQAITDVNKIVVRDVDGGTVSTTKPEDTEYEITYRLIADEGMELVKGDIRTICVDTDDITGWTEEPAPEPEEPEPEDDYVL